MLDTVQKIHSQPRPTAPAEPLRSTSTMTYLAGMDEAGYGPTLGPLVVTGVACRIPTSLLNQSLWHILRSSCTKKPNSRDRRLTIADSKQLTRRKPNSPVDPSPDASARDANESHSTRPLGNLAQLERAALVILAAQNHSPRNLDDLLQLIAPSALIDRNQYPWYAGWIRDIPLAATSTDISTCANSVRLDCTANQIQFVDVSCEVVFEGHFNTIVKKTRNKATLLQSVGMRILDRIIRLAKNDNENVRIIADRLGGRTHYREAVTMLLPDHQLQILEESDTRSAYRSRLNDRTVDIEFLVNGETNHLPVALASIYSKYLRELFMHAFNDYWSRHVPNIKPTAGYYTDAHRWLADASPTLRRLSINPDTLIRLC